MASKGSRQHIADTCARCFCLLHLRQYRVTKCPGKPAKPVAGMRRRWWAERRHELAAKAYAKTLGTTWEALDQYFEPKTTNKKQR